MRRQTQQRWRRWAQRLVLAGLSGGALWNVATLGWGWPELPGWGLPLLAGPGLLTWAIVTVAPTILAPTGPRGQAFRLTYRTGSDWDDRPWRQALLTLTRLGGRFDLVWADDGPGPAVWVLIDDAQVLSQMAADLLPGFELEADSPPAPTAGVAVLQWQTRPSPPDEWCRQPGVTGLYFRWLSERRAVVAVWGEGAAASAGQYARPDDLLPGEGEALLRPRFSGDNPWPELPRFPPSSTSPGLSATVRLDLTAPALRLNGRDGLVLGRDAGGQAVGVSLPALTGLKQLQVYGRESEAVVMTLAVQAIRAGVPVVLLDGSGRVGARLRRELSREAAADQVLFGDADRPARSRLRLNPFRLPSDQTVWPAVFEQWSAWLQELGVTPAGLGLAACRHTRAAVILTALLAARQGLVLDPPALQAALEAPAYLTTAGERLPEAAEMLEPALWRWWQETGVRTPGFDAHLRLRPLRERLAALLALAEYRVLWRGPYLDPLAAWQRGQSLIWRLPDPRQRLRPYLTSQLAALAAALNAWPAEAGPVLLILHELEPGEWADRLAASAAARLALTGPQPLPGRRPLTGDWLLSRLDRAGAEWVQQAAGDLNGRRAADLRRLAPGHLLWRRGQSWGALDLMMEQTIPRRLNNAGNDHT